MRYKGLNPRRRPVDPSSATVGLRRRLEMPMRCLTALALLFALLPTRAEQPQLTAEEAATIEAVIEVVRAISSDKLRPYVARLQRLDEHAVAGEFDQGVDEAQRTVVELSRLPVTEEEMAARAMLLALATTKLGDLQALAGRLSEGQRSWRSVQEMDIPVALKAQCMAGEATLAVLELQFATAAGQERQALRLAPGMFEPIMPGIERLFAGQPEAAMPVFAPAVLRGSNQRYALLYAAGGALALGRQGQAEHYLDQIRGVLGFHPHFYLFSGMTAGMAGDLTEAQRLFAEGARREHGRVRLNGLLSGAAQAAGGQAATGLAAIRTYLGAAPATFQAVGRAILGSPALAAGAVRDPSVWFRPLDLTAMTGGQPFETRPPWEGEGESPVDVTSAPGGPPPAGGTGGGPTVTQGPDDSGLRVVDASTQAVEAYRAGLKLLAEGKLWEAEQAVTAALVMRASFPEAWLALGELLLRRADHDGATRAYAIAARQRPASAEAAYGFALGCDAQGNAARAAAAFRAALERGLSGAPAEHARQRLVALAAEG